MCDYSSGACKSLCCDELARPYWPTMVTTRQVRRALRELMGAEKPGEFAEAAGVDRATVYRVINVEGNKDYTPQIETIAAMAMARGLTLSQFFLTIEAAARTTSTAENRPSETHSRAGDGDPVQAERAARSLLDTNTVLVAMGEAIADGIDRGIERLLKARKQDAAAGDRAPERDADHRENRG
jgi:DNA-binding phage protein